MWSVFRFSHVKALSISHFLGGRVLPWRKKTWVLSSVHPGLPCQTYFFSCIFRVQIFSCCHKALYCIGTDYALSILYILCVGCTKMHDSVRAEVVDGLKR